MDIIPLSQINISSLAHRLRQSETLVYPTETCYGLGCDATNESAVQKLFRIKKRDEGKPMLVVFSTVAEAFEYIEWSPLLEQVASKYWPGALTVVAKLKGEARISPLLVGKDGTMAFRVSSHPLVHEFTTFLGVPLVSTSANIAGEDNPYDVNDIIARFSGETEQPDIVINAGVLPFAQPSTIVRFLDGTVEILRQGEIQIDREEFRQ